MNLVWWSTIRPMSTSSKNGAELVVVEHAVVEVEHDAADAREAAVALVDRRFHHGLVEMRGQSLAGSMRPRLAEVQPSSATTETRRVAGRHQAETGRGQLRVIDRTIRRSNGMLDYIRRAIGRANHRKRVKLDLETLQAMDERMLRDIGITRAEIDEAQRRVRWMA
jgi:uncharacterized protein YjiS (DUF1127 family)